MEKLMNNNIDDSMNNTQNEKDEKTLKLFTATQYQLMWWRFRRHKLAMFGGFLLLIYLIIIVFAEVIAVVGVQTRDKDYVFGFCVGGLVADGLHVVTQIGSRNLR